LTLGIKNEIEDLNGAFKKMAVLKPETESVSFDFDEPSIVDDDDISIVHTTQSNILKEPENQQEKIAEPEQNVFLNITDIAFTKKISAKKKPSYIDPNQLTLFNLLTVSA
jgi:hypothetical protein